MSTGFLFLVGAMWGIAFIGSSHLFYLRVPAFRYVPSLLLALAALLQVAAAGAAAHPADAVVHVLLAMMLGLVFLLTVSFTAFLPLFSGAARGKPNEEDS